MQRSRFTSTPKKSAAEQRADDVKQYSIYAAAAHRALAEVVDLVSDYEAVQDVVRFVRSHEKVPTNTIFVVGCQEWLSKHEAAYKAAVLERAWTSLPVRLIKWAASRQTRIDGLAEKLTEAKEKGYGRLQVLSWGDDAFKAAAEYDVAMGISRNVAEMIGKGVQADEGFALLDEHISSTCKRHGGDTGSSSSALSNLASSCERVAWFKMAERNLRRPGDFW